MTCAKGDFEGIAACSLKKMSNSPEYEAFLDCFSKNNSDLKRCEAEGAQLLLAAGKFAARAIKTIQGQPSQQRRF